MIDFALDRIEPLGIVVFFASPRDAFLRKFETIHRIARANEPGVIETVEKQFPFAADNHGAKLFVIDPFQNVVTRAIKFTGYQAPLILVEFRALLAIVPVKLHAFVCKVVNQSGMNRS